MSDDVEEKKSQLFTPDDNKHVEKIKVLPTVVPPTKNETKSDPIDKTKQLIVPSVPSSEQPKQTIFVQQKPEQKFLNLFNDEPPMLNEPIRTERKPVNLFLDSDDDGNDPVRSVTKPSSIFNNNVTNRPSLFSTPQVDNTPTENKSTNDVKNNNAPVVASSKSKPTLKSNDFGGLFDDEPPDDFFDIIVREQGVKVDNMKTEKPKLQTKTVNLFESDDDDDDDFSKIIGTAKKNDCKVAAVDRSTKENIADKSDDDKTSPTIKQIAKTEVTHSPYSSPFKSLQNTGPPKSYVSFLDDDSLSFDDDKEENKPIESQTPAVPDSRKGLFDDSPPDDVIVPVTSNRKSPAKIIYDDIAETLQENKSAQSSTISSQSLFDDIPPDDINATPVALPRKSSLKATHHSVANSSLNPTAVLSNATSTPVSKKEANANDGPTRDETDQSLSFRKNLSLFSNPEVAKLPTVEKDNKPRPNKLKTNFNINVAALLPGAKLPSQKQSATAKQDRIDETEPEKIENEIIEKVIPSSSVTQVRSANSEDTSGGGRLTSLSKNRAKIKVQRKPSTRTGRQNLYNKSLVAENENVASSIETTDSLGSEANVKEQVDDVVPSSEKILETAVESVDWLIESTDQEPPPLDSNNPNSNVIDDDEEDWLKTVDEKPASPSKTNLGADDDWLSTKVVNIEQKPAAQSLSHVMNYDWLTASSLPPDDINPPSAIDDDHEQDDWLSSYVSKEKSSAVADLPNEDDDWLISAVTQEQKRDVGATVASAKKEEKEDWLSKSETNNNEKVDDDDWLINSLAVTKASTNKTEKIPVSDVVNDKPVGVDFDGETTVASKTETEKTIKSKLFDSDDVTDKLDHNRSKLDFGGESSYVFESKTETKKFINSTLFDDDDDEDDVVPPQTKAPSIDFGKASAGPPRVESGGDILQSKAETNKSLKSRLFDDDVDDDDLFTSISKQKSVAKQTNSNTTEAVKTTKNVSIKAKGKSLFSDDDNSDSDDLFGTTKSTKKQNEKIATGNQSKVSKPVKTGLFDDEDDEDDDIFSSKTQKQRVVQSDRKKKSSVTKLVATIPASNDPLADLLK